MYLSSHPVAPGTPYPGAGRLLQQPPVTDRAIVQAVLDGDPGAFDRLTAFLDPTIERCLDRIVRRFAVAAAHRDDLKQAVHMQLFVDDHRVLRSFRGEAKLTTWMHAVATRTLHAEVGRLTRRTDREVDDAALSKLADPAETPEQIIVRHAQDSRVRAVLATCSERDQVLVSLLFEQRVTAEAAASLLGLRPSAVRMRKKRLLSKLEKKLKGLWP